MTTTSLSKLERDVVELIERAKIHRSCVSCMQFDEDNEACALAGGARPPARIIAMGCDAWEEPPPF